MVADVWGRWRWRGDPRGEVGVSGSLSMWAEERVRGVWKAGESMKETSWRTFLTTMGGERGLQSGRCALTHLVLWMKRPQAGQECTWSTLMVQPQWWQVGLGVVLLAPDWEEARGTRREEVEVGTMLGSRGMSRMAVLMAESWCMSILWASMNLWILGRTNMSENHSATVQPVPMSPPCRWILDLVVCRCMVTVWREEEVVEPTVKLNLMSCC